MKIAIIGYSGSGKSTTAKKLGLAYSVPVLHLDTVQFLPGWVERPLEESQQIVKSFMYHNENWVIEDNYSAFLQKERLEMADKIIFFDFPRRVCFPRVVKRFFIYKGKTRPDMAQGCNEKLDFEFIKWVLIEGRGKKHHDKFEKIMEIYKDKAVRVKNQREVDELLKQLSM